MKDKVKVNSVFIFFFKQKTAYEMLRSLVGSEMCIRDSKVAEGRPHIVDMLKNEEIQLVFNTTEGRKAIADSSMIRRTALRHRVYCTTTIAGALAACEALAYGNNMSVYTLQDLHAQPESN